MTRQFKYLLLTLLTLSITAHAALVITEEEIDGETCQFLDNDGLRVTTVITPSDFRMPTNKTSISDLVRAENIDENTSYYTPQSITLKFSDESSCVFADETGLESFIIVNPNEEEEEETETSVITSNDIDSVSCLTEKF